MEFSTTLLVVRERPGSFTALKLIPGIRESFAFLIPTVT